MLSAAVSNGNYGGAGLLRPHLGDPVTALAPFWGSHFIPLFTLPVSVGEPCPEPQPQSHPTALTPSAAAPPLRPLIPGHSSEGNLIRLQGAPRSPSTLLSSLTAPLGFGGGFFQSLSRSSLSTAPPIYSGACAPATTVYTLGSLSPPPLPVIISPKGWVERF